MIQGLVQLLIFQALGEIASKFVLPFIPGPVLGLIFLLAFLILSKNIPSSMTSVSQALLDNLGVLFVPAAVGVVLYLPLLQANWVALSLVLCFSVCVTIGMTALVLKWLTHRLEG
jgi:holin-like protein